MLLDSRVRPWLQGHDLYDRRCILARFVIPLTLFLHWSGSCGDIVVHVSPRRRASLVFRYDTQHPALGASFDITLSREQRSVWSMGAEGVHVAEKLTSIGKLDSHS